MELKLGILNVKNKIAKKDPSMELFDLLRHEKKDVLTETHGWQLNNAVFVLVLKQSSEHFVMVWIFANKIRKQNWKWKKLTILVWAASQWK